ncbi:hypothetical protein FPJ91_17070 [Mycobacterium tuberculosis]|nr:hypothetical protein FPJ91_17070 [Mycobacterium tuberculosis]
MRHFLRLTFAGRFEGSRDDRPLLGYDTPTGLTCPYTTPPGRNSPPGSVR